MRRSPALTPGVRRNVLAPQVAVVHPLCRRPRRFCAGVIIVDKSLLPLNIFWVPVRSNAPRSFPFLAQLCNILKIDKDYRTYERVIREMKAKEDEMAVTFVDKVSTCVMA